MKMIEAVFQEKDGGAELGRKEPKSGYETNSDLNSGRRGDGTGHPSEVPIRGHESRSARACAQSLS